MKRIYFLIALLAISLGIGFSGGASAQEAPPEPVSPTYGTRDNPWTFLMQDWLADNGFRPGPTDGWYDKQTRQAVVRFQQAVGIEQTGAWTWEVSQAQQAYVPPPSPMTATSSGYGVWDRLAQCESNGNWSINTGNGYFGGLQFSLGSWRAAGGSGYPHHHSREEQIRVAENLLDMQGWGAWPTCHEGWVCDEPSR